MEKIEIPVWEKAVITVTEASALASGLNTAIIRAEAWKSIENHVGNFPAYKVGRKVCIIREGFLKWLADHGARHTKFSVEAADKQLKTLREQQELTPIQLGRGRPRKVRC